MKAAARREAAQQRLQLARQFLQQRASMLRNTMTPAEYLAFRLGCTYQEAERLVGQLKEEGTA